MKEKSMPAAPPAMSPVHLLVNYELTRTNQALVSQLQNAKKQVEEAQYRVESIRNSLNNLVILLTSISMDHSQLPNDNTVHLLRPLILQFKRTMTALIETSDIGVQNDAMVDLLSELKRLCIVPNESQEPTFSDDRLETLESPWQEQPHNPQACANQSEYLFSAPTPIKIEESPVYSDAAISDEPHLFPQHCRTLKAYLVDAKAVREFHKLKGTYDEVAFIETFIDGLENGLYKRRIIHVLRKEDWEWHWVKHMVKHLIREEKYFAKQDYALAHRQEDGSVLLPDGTKQHHFAVLERITDADLTGSEDYVEG